MPMIAIERTDIPQMDTGAPLPVVIADESAVLLSFLLSEGGAAFLRFERVLEHRFGLPGDETLQAHPLYAAGVRWYAAFEIEGSHRVEELKRIDSVHPNHSPARFEDYTHFLFAFHDSSFDCVARSFHQTIRPLEDCRERLHFMLQALENKNIFTAEASAVGMR